MNEYVKKNVKDYLCTYYQCFNDPVDKYLRVFGNLTNCHEDFRCTRIKDVRHIFFKLSKSVLTSELFNILFNKLVKEGHNVSIDDNLFIIIYESSDSNHYKWFLFELSRSIILNYYILDKIKNSDKNLLLKVTKRYNVYNTLQFLFYYLSSFGNNNFIPKNMYYSTISIKIFLLHNYVFGLSDMTNLSQYSYQFKPDIITYNTYIQLLQTIRNNAVLSFNHNSKKTIVNKINLLIKKKLIITDNNPLFSNIKEVLLDTRKKSTKENITLDKNTSKLLYDDVEQESKILRKKYLPIKKITSIEEAELFYRQYNKDFKQLLNKFIKHLKYFN